MINNKKIIPATNQNKNDFEYPNPTFTKQEINNNYIDMVALTAEIVDNYIMLKINEFITSKLDRLIMSELTTTYPQIVKCVASTKIDKSRNGSFDCFVLIEVEQKAGKPFTFKVTKKV